MDNEIIKIPWIEKYRPINLNKVISHEHLLSMLKKYVDRKTFPNLVVYGSPGIGKTSIIKACASELFGEHVNEMTLEINASEDRGIETVRTRITQFANCSNSFFSDGKIQIKLVILDEADSMTDDAQIALKNTIDEYPTTKFCLICNCVKKIHYPIISRCIIFRLHAIPKKQMFAHAKNICSLENMNVSNDALDIIINFSGGDMRKIMNVLQSLKTAYSDNLINLDCIVKYLNQIPDSSVNNILSLLTNDSMKINETFYEINKLVNDNGYSYYELICKINNKLVDKINVPLYSKIIKSLGSIEYQIFTNVNQQIILLSLISAFMLK